MLSLIMWSCSYVEVKVAYEWMKDTKGTTSNAA